MVVLGRGGVSYERGTPAPPAAHARRGILQGIKSPFPGRRFALALAGIGRRVVHIKEIEKDDLVAPGRREESFLKKDPLKPSPQTATSKISTGASKIY